MKIAYLMNSYPMTSTTFIRREIEALEALGLSIQRYAIRVWPGKLVDPRDVAEQERTCYLLTGNIRGLVLALVKEVFLNPKGLYRAFWIWLALLRRSHDGFVRHAAYLMEASYFRQIAQSDNISHIHSHFATNATAVAMLSHVMGGPSYSFTVHGPDEFVDVERLSFDIKIRYAAFVAAISRFCEEQLLRLSPPGHNQKILIARCGLPMEEFDLIKDLAAENQTFVCVGRLCEQKGQILIPAAAATLRDEFPKLRIILVGDGESRQQIEASITKYKVGEVVALAGWVANSDVLEMVGASRALLLPSYAEGLPIVIMEALALGRPVISTLIAGIPELVDDSCGWLFPAGDREALIAAMRAALICTPAELAIKGAAGRARVERLHNLRVLAQLLLQKFQETSA